MSPVHWRKPYRSSTWGGLLWALSLCAMLACTETIPLGGAPACDFAVNSRFAAWHGSIGSNLQPAARARPRGPKKSDKLYDVNDL